MSNPIPPAATRTGTKGRGGKRGKVRSKPKGRAVDPKALEEVRALLGDAPRRRDLLIEHLHKIQDRYYCLSAAHVVALASEMKLAMTEVYEVATFYHHFDVVKEGDPAPPAITVRVCDSIACELAGSHELLEKLPSLLGSGIRVLHAPCVGRCEQAPVAVVHQNPIPNASCESRTSPGPRRAVEVITRHGSSAESPIWFTPRGSGAAGRPSSSNTSRSSCARTGS